MVQSAADAQLSAALKDAAAAGFTGNPTPEIMSEANRLIGEQGNEAAADYLRVEQWKQVNTFNAQRNATAHQSQSIALDPNSLLDAAANGGRQAGPADNRAAAQMNNLKMLVPDAELDKVLVQSGVRANDPKAREHARRAVHEAWELAAGDIASEAYGIASDAYIKHANHMGLNPQATLDQVQQLETQKAALMEQGQALAADISAREEKQKKGGTIALISGAAATATAGIATLFSGWNKKLSALPKWSSIALIATSVGAVITWAGAKLLGGDPQKLEAEANEKAGALQSQFLQLEATQVQLIKAEQAQFVAVHVQRSMHGFEQARATEKLKAAQQGHPAASDPLPTTPPVENQRLTAPGAQSEIDAPHTPQHGLDQKPQNGTMTQNPAADASHGNFPQTSYKTPTTDVAQITGQPNAEAGADASHSAPPFDTDRDFKVDGGVKPPYGTTGLPSAETAQPAADTPQSAPGDQQRPVPSFASYTAAQEPPPAPIGPATAALQKQAADKSNSIAPDERHFP